MALGRVWLAREQMVITGVHTAHPIPWNGTGYFAPVCIDCTSRSAVSVNSFSGFVVPRKVCVRVLIIADCICSEIG